MIPFPERPKVSVLINTLNEERNIRRCLESVKWADEIVVVDMHSDDRTIEIAREYTDRIHLHPRMGYADPARQFALDQASHDWVLVVDADELVPLALSERLLAIAASEPFDAVLIPHRNYIFGRLMAGSGWAPLQDMHVRFFKKTMMSYGNRVHRFAQLDPSARIYRLLDPDCGFIHFNYLDVEHFLSKLNRYTTIEAENEFQAGVPFNLRRTLLRAAWEVVNRLVFKRGYRDGFQGLVLASLMVSYRLAAAEKLRLMHLHGSTAVADGIHQGYDEVAARVLAEYAQQARGTSPEPSRGSEARG